MAAKDIFRRYAVKGIFICICLLLPVLARAGNYFQGVSPSSVFWPGGLVPYKLDPSYNISATESNVIVAGLREWELAGKVKFVPYTNQANYVLLQYTNDGSGTGYCLSGTPFTMMLHGLARGLMCHEGGHLLGLQHEHQRLDRNNYITVNYGNIYGGTNGEGAAEFLIDSNSIAFGSYDLQSVMHYSQYDFTNGLGDSLDPLLQYTNFYYKIGNLALSIGDRASVSNLYGATPTPLTNIVTTTADGGFGSLRAAIYYANDHPGTTIKFNIPTSDPNYNSGVYTIYLIGELPPLVTAGTVIDGTTQNGYASHPVIALDGSQVSPEAGPVSGLHLYGTNCTVRALAIDNFTYTGIQLWCPTAISNVIQGCYIGLKPDGTTSAPNDASGIYFQHGPSANIIGGTNAAQRNVISGNLYYGIQINDPNSNTNVIIGNYIGLNAAGTAAVPNTYSGIGIWDGPVGTIIGATNSGARNVISGNLEDGVALSYSNVYGAVIQGNYLGTDYTGSNAVPNINSGINIFQGAHGMTIGGTNSLMRNIASGNAYTGIIIQGPGSTNNVVQGNYVGTDPTGSNAVPNAQIGIGVWGGATGNLVGGTNAGTANVASGNLLYGILVADLGTSNNLVEGNFAGLDASGKIAVPNGSAGVVIQNGANNNIVGGLIPAAANVVSGNMFYNVVIGAGGNYGNIIEGNLIGVDITGTNGLNLSGSGVGLYGASTANIIGGTTAGAANVISGNGNEGILISDFGTTGNFIEGNFIGTDAHSTKAIPNGDGVYIDNSAGTNIIGGLTPAAANVVSANNSIGVAIVGPSDNGNIVEGNYIGTDITGRKPLGNVYAGVAIYGGSQSNLIGGTSTGARNIISDNGTYGITLSDAGTSGNIIQGNLIGTDSTGTNALGNPPAPGYGANVELQAGASGNFIGGIAPGAGNVIAFSDAVGISLFETDTTNNAIRGNSIFNNTYLGIDLNYDGVTPNHVGFAAGPNDLQNYPIITNAIGYGSVTVVAGTLNSLPNQSYSIDLYRNLSPDSSGYGQGQFYLGTVSVNTDGSGNAKFAYTNSSGNYAGQYICATAVSAGGDTSEFSADYVAAAGPSAQFAGPYQAGSSSFSFNVILQTNFNYHILTATNLNAPVTWVSLTNFFATNSPFFFVDHKATNRMRFYRVTSP
ncbi:MAG TPA: M12 family metallopeptidase [Pseudomonadales bacterium]|nr:M12 family metallopeptidase [Pseudomonadales bacterium]